MFADLLLNPLSGVTLLAVIALGTWQVRRMQRLKGRTKPSALAQDGDAHDPQP